MRAASHLYCPPSELFLAERNPFRIESGQFAKMRASCEKPPSKVRSEFGTASRWPRGLWRLLSWQLVFYVEQWTAVYTMIGVLIWTDSLDGV